MAAAGIVMETINLPEGNAFGVDDVESGTPTVNYAEHQAENAVLCVGHSNRAEMGHFWRAPRRRVFGNPRLRGSKGISGFRRHQSQGSIFFQMRTE